MDIDSAAQRAFSVVPRLSRASLVRYPYDHDHVCCSIRVSCSSFWAFSLFHASVFIPKILNVTHMQLSTRNLRR